MCRERNTRLNGEKAALAACGLGAGPPALIRNSLCESLARVQRQHRGKGGEKVNFLVRWSSQVLALVLLAGGKTA